MNQNDVIFMRIAEALLCDYSSIYYVNAVTNEYLTYSLDTQFRSLKIEFEGKDFFKQLIPDAEKVVHPDDRHIFQEDIQKENLLQDMKDGIMRRWLYRLMINGQPVYHELRMIRGVNGKDDYFILGVTNVDKEVRMRQQAEQLERERKIYNQIAESLAKRYDTIYYVEADTNAYIEFSASEPYRKLEIPKSGSDFFITSYYNLSKYAHPDDTERILTFIDKKNILERLKKERIFDTKYRLHMDGTYRYTRLSIMWANDQKHIIIGVEDIDEQVKHENEHIRELRTANEKAMSDELTGVKNKNAYQETECNLQKAIETQECPPFGLMVCDLNNLKQINDTLGHKAGDESIRAACHTICVIFSHSPVFRIGGDEFVVLLKGNDYTNREKLIVLFQEHIMQNIKKENAPVVASGFAEYLPGQHSSVSDVFELADSRMYENKRKLKTIQKNIFNS